MTIESWRDGVQPAAVPESYLLEVERILGARFPDAYRERMLAKNGGLVRTGARYWKLQPIDHPDQPLSKWNLWADRNSLILYALKNARTFQNRRGIAIAVSLYDGNAGKSLYLFCDANDSKTISPEVWRWGYSIDRPVKLLDHVSDLWRDDPYKIAKPKLNWKLKPLKVSPSVQEKQFRRHRKKSSASNPASSDWLNMATFPLAGSRLFVGDLAKVPNEDSHGVQLGKAEYLVRFRAIAYGNDIRIAKLQMVRNGVSCKKAEIMHHVTVDVGAVTMHDMDQELLCEPSVLQELSDRLMDVSLTAGYKVMSFGPTALVTASAGFGDGDYPIFALRSAKGNLVGIEIEFIGEGVQYPFDQSRNFASDGDEKDFSRWLLEAIRWGRTGSDIVASIAAVDGPEKYERMNDFQVLLRHQRRFRIGGKQKRQSANVIERSSNFLEHMFMCRGHLASALRLMHECHGAHSIKSVLQDCQEIGATKFAVPLASALKAMQSEGSFETVLYSEKAIANKGLYSWRKEEKQLFKLLPQAVRAWEKFADAQLADIDFVAEYETWTAEIYKGMSKV